MNTKPGNDILTSDAVSDIQFDDVFKIEYQLLQDLFSNASGVASIITLPDGTPIANWLIGQIRNESTDEKQMSQYADEIGADREDFMKAMNEVPVMPVERFKNVAKTLFVFANELSEKGYTNLQLKKQIAERDKAIMLLQKKEEINRTILKNAHEIFFQTDLNGIIFDITPSLKYLSYFNCNELIGTSVFNLYYDAKERNFLQNTFAKRCMIKDYEVRIKTKADEITYFIINTHLISDFKGEPKRTVWSFIDITEGKRTELLLQEKNKRIVMQNKELQQINEELNHTNIELIATKEKAEECDRLKTAFLTNMSHEIRTPMNGILGFAELLKQPGLTRKEKREYLCDIKKSGLRMLNIINNLIDISKVESGQMEISFSDMNVNEQIEYVHKLFEPEVNRKGMQLSFQNGLPTEEAFIRTDREKLCATLSNLINNAIKYSDKGSIEFGYMLKHKYLEFFIKDKGIGIPNDKKEVIFDRFIQADITDKRAFQGAGLGLALSKSYVVMLGGNIWAESEEGKGSTFYFTIPYNAIPNKNIVRKNIVLPDTIKFPRKKTENINW